MLGACDVTRCQSQKGHPPQHARGSETECGEESERGREGESEGEWEGEKVLASAPIRCNGREGGNDARLGGEDVPGENAGHEEIHVPTLSTIKRNRSGKIESSVALGHRFPYRVRGPSRAQNCDSQHIPLRHRRHISCAPSTRKEWAHPPRPRVG